ncbi:MFS transporter [Rhodoferax sp.]|uniref:MFS transporter n=1 Tax=Rhodoferax sp. TaxID=50421 RepID=UPI0025D5DF1B|nr:MFS transporter [Rhodoferax sp.]MCM2342575.1 MFS transporter [Rhodoferax sp.]
MADSSVTNRLSRRNAILVFIAFAFAYFLSALIRAITATLSPTLTQEFVLDAQDLGLLAGGYFLGFAATQLPLGAWLDRYGPKKVIVYFLLVAVLGCAAFAMADSFKGLLLARVLTGVGVSACLMAPLTGYRRWFEAASQMRANSWMLMTGSFGMVASTMPVQWLIPLVGWRALFWGLAALVFLAMLLISWQAPHWQNAVPAADSQAAAKPSYGAVWRHPYFRSMAPMAFFIYGGLVAMQTLWVSPWMIRVAGFTPLQAAMGLFWINMAMLITFWTWGMVYPGFARRGYTADRLIGYGMPVSFILLTIIIAAGPAIGVWAGVAWALYCVSCTFISLAQPAVAMAFPANLAGRAMSSYNLLIFAGVFAVQWGIGLAIDGFRALGWQEVSAFQMAMTVYLLCTVASYAYFVATKSHNQATS